MKKYKIEFWGEKNRRGLFVLVAIGFKKLDIGFEIAFALFGYLFGFQILEK